MRGKLVPLPGRDAGALGERRIHGRSRLPKATSRAPVANAASPRGIRSSRPPPLPAGEPRRDRARGLVGEPGLQFAEVLRGAERAPAIVDRAERHAQVRRHALDVEVARVDGGEREAPDRLPEDRGERLTVGPALGAVGQLGRDLRRPFGGRHDLPAQHLRQRAQHRRDELVAQARHLPVEPGRSEPGEQHEGHLHGHAVVVGARLEPVAQREGLVALPPAVGEPVVLHRLVVVADEVGRPHREQLGGRAVRAAPPAFERARVRDVGRHSRLVEGDDRFVAREDVAAAGALLDLAEFAAQGAVRAHEGEEPLVEAGRVPVLVDEGVPDEELACERRVDPRELDAPLRDDRHAEQGDLLVGDRRTLPAFPAGFAVAALGERAGELLGPGGVDRGVRAGEQAAGLDEFGAHQRRRRLLRERRPREHDEPRVAGADELGLRTAALALALAGGARSAPTARRLRVVAQSELREQPREQSAVDAVGVRFARLLGDMQAERLRESHELAVEVLPLAHRAGSSGTRRGTCGGTRCPRARAAGPRGGSRGSAATGSRSSGRRSGRGTRRPARASRAAVRAGPGS